VIVLSLGTLASIVLLTTTLIVLWPQLKSSGAPNVSSLDGTSLLHTGALDCSLITARLSEVDASNTDELRRAGLFVVALVNGKLVPIDTYQHNELSLPELGKFDDNADTNK
jgi:hypothetical protein